MSHKAQTHIAHFLTIVPQGLSIQQRQAPLPRNVHSCSDVTRLLDGNLADLICIRNDLTILEHFPVLCP